MTDWLHYLDECDSTNSWAMTHAAKLEHGSCVWTQCQKAGRGQLQRKWLSDPGVLTCSFVFDLLDVSHGPWLSLATGLSVCHAITDVAPSCPKVGIKWPNDCYLRDRKLAGILCESKVVPATTAHASNRLVAIVGIGINLNPQWANSPPADSYTGQEPPISLADCVENDSLPSHQAVMTALRVYLLQAIAMIADGRTNELVNSIQEHDWLQGRWVSYTNDQQLQYIAQASGISEQGELIVCSHSGDTIRITSSHSVNLLPQQ